MDELMRDRFLELVYELLKDDDSNQRANAIINCADEYAESMKQQWIPVEERLPEEHEWIGTKRFGTTISDEVYVTFEAPDGQRFTDHINFQNGKLSRLDAEIMREWHKGAKPIAWMPFPEPYQGGGEQE